MIGTWFPSMYQNQIYQVPQTISYNTSNSFDWYLSDSLDLDPELFLKNSSSVDKFIKNFIRSTSFTPQTSEQMSKLLQILQLCISNLRATVDTQKDQIEQLKSKNATCVENAKVLKQKLYNKTSVMCPLCSKGYHKMKRLDQHFAKRHHGQLKYWLIVRGKKSDIIHESNNETDDSKAQKTKIQRIDIDDEELTLRVLEAMNKTTYRTDRQKLIQNKKLQSDSEFDFEPRPLQPFNQQKQLNRTMPMPRKRTPIKRSVIHKKPPEIKSGTDSESIDSPKPFPKIVRKRVPPPELRKSSEKLEPKTKKDDYNSKKKQNEHNSEKNMTDEGENLKPNDTAISMSDISNSIPSENEAPLIPDNAAIRLSADDSNSSDENKENANENLISTDMRDPSPPNLNIEASPATPKDSSTSDFDYESDPSSVEFVFVARPPVKPVALPMKSDDENTIPNWAATDIREESEAESKSVSISASGRSLSESASPAHSRQRSDKRRMSWSSEYDNEKE